MEHYTTTLTTLTTHAAIVTLIESYALAHPTAEVEQMAQFLKRNMADAFTTDWQNTSLESWRTKCHQLFKPPWKEEE